MWSVDQSALSSPAETEKLKSLLLEDASKLGALSQNLPESEGRETFYLTTAIAYMNGVPHIGHAYEFISADALVRLYRLLGRDTYFVTGADEHGQKVEASAFKMGRPPQQHCDEYVRSFIALNEKLYISCDDYVRTTDARHKALAQRLWSMCAASEDIYLQRYEGWYNEREECFVTDTDAALTQYKDPGSGLDYKRLSEESYFFRMSKYASRLIAHIEEHPQSVEPESARNELLARLRDPEGLRDVCISRTTFKWGVPVPPGFDEKHIMYVWFDALSNYLTGVDALNTDSELSRYWPADRHIIGKDIKWFHCVIWPCMLMSAGVPLFQQVFSHGFVNAADGRKMSKSYNNTIDPNDILQKYPVDTIRYYMLAAATYGSDLNFSEDALVQCHNSELADVLGNLLHRVVNLCHKYCGGVVPQCEHDPAWTAPFDARALAAELPRLAADSALHLLAFKGMDAVRSINKFLTAAEPWKMKGADEARRVPVVRTVMEAIYVAAHFLAPIMPVVAENIFKKLGTGPRALFSLNLDFYNLTPGTPVTIGEILFTKLLPPGVAEEPTQAGGLPAAGGAASSKAAKAGDADAAAAAAAAAEAASFSDGKYFIADDPEQLDFTKMEVRVGQITRCWNHPEAERLFCEEVHLGGGAANSRQVASGLRQHYTLEQMTGRRVLLVCNLKTAKLAGFESCGMVLAAKSEDGSRVELVDPPDGAELGERVFLGGAQRMQGEAWSANKADKKKVWKAVAEHLRTDGSRQLSWKGHPVLTSAGPCTVSTLVDVLVS